MKAGRFLLALAGLAMPAAAAGDVFWNEATNGDISGDRMAPTGVQLGAGTHSLMGQVAGGDLDYLKITLAPGMRLAQINLVSYESLDGTAFIGVQSGPVFTEPPEIPNVANILGYSHFGPFAGNVGTDILDDIGAGFGAIGFTPPLPTGTYTFWIQQLGRETTYQMDFVVEPATCYANCDGSTIPPILNVNDFICFQTKYAGGDPTANCDGSTIPPVLNVNDFICFQTQYAAGCP